MSLISRLSHSPLFLGVLVTLGLVGGYLFAHPGHAAAANGYGCGVTTGSESSLAGVVINLVWVKSDGTQRQDSDDTVTIQTASPSSTHDSSGNPANVAKMSSDDGTEIATAHQRTFSQVPADCGGKGSVVVLGYGKTSPDTASGWDYWALDCDVSKHPGTFQEFNIWPNGIPSGATTGGYWTTSANGTRQITSGSPYRTDGNSGSSSQGRNGFTFSLTFYYIEPPSHTYKGHFDDISCTQTTIWAEDTDHPSDKVQAKVVFSGGPGGLAPLGPAYANTAYAGTSPSSANHKRWTNASAISTYTGNADVTAKLYVYDQNNNILKDSSGNNKVFDTATISEPCNGPPNITVAGSCTTKTLTGAAWDNDKFSNTGPAFITVVISYEGGAVATVVANQAEANGHTHGFSVNVASLYPNPNAPTTHTFTLVAKGVNSSGTADGVNKTVTYKLSCGTPITGANCPGLNGAGENTTPSITLTEATPAAPGPYGYSLQSGATTTRNAQYYYEHPVGYKITSALDQWATNVTWIPTGEQTSATFTLDYTNYVNQYPYDDHTTTVNYTEYFNETYQYSSPNPDYYTCNAGDGNPDSSNNCTHSYTGSPAACPGGSSGSNVAIYNSSGQYVWDQCLVYDGAPKSDGTCATGSKYNGSCYTFVSWAGVNCWAGGSPSGGTSCSYQYLGQPWYNWHTGGTTNNKPSNNAQNTAQQLLQCFPRNFDVQGASQTDVSGVTFDDYENPTQVQIGTRVAVQFTLTHGGGVHLPMLVNGLNYNGTYYIEHADGSTSILATDSRQVGVGSTTSSGQTVTNNVPTPQPITYSVSLPPLTTGDEICAEFSVDPSGTTMDENGSILSSDGTVSSTGIPGGSSCSAPVQNQPYSRFYGNDVLAGVRFPGGTCNSSAAITSNSRGTTGSGSQFAAMSLGAINGFASAFLRGIAPTQPTGLTFSNTNGGTYKGNFASGSPTFNCTQLPDYMGDKPSDSQTVASLSSIGGGLAPLGGTVAFSAPGGTLGGLSVPAGSNTSIFVDGDVYITGDISFDNSGWSYDSTDRTTTAPSFFLIVKGNIDIAPGVHQLDGVYVSEGSSGTGGTIRTCSASSNSSYAPNGLFDACNSQLIVNGAFIAQDVKLDRSFSSLRHSQSGENPLNGPGHDCDPNGLVTAQDCSAEIFNFSPELYLSNPALQPASGPTLNKYDYITSLSPVL